MAPFAFEPLKTYGTRLADPIRLLRIDASNIGDHFHLTADDECYFLFEYTSGHDYTFSATNSLISNLKKKPSESHRRGYHHKTRVIQECSSYFSGGINPDWLNTATLVPVPPSKAAGHPDYDDRITRICRGISAQPTLDVRQLVFQTESLLAAHETGEGERPTVERFLQVYKIDESKAAPAPTQIGIFDDVLTAGVHYRAMHSILAGRFPGVSIVGIFVARRVFANPFQDVVD